MDTPILVTAVPLCRRAIALPGLEGA